MRSRILRWVRRILIAGSSLVIALLAGGAAYQWIATRLTEQKHPAPGVLIDVGGCGCIFTARGADARQLLLTQD